MIKLAQFYTATAQAADLALMLHPCVTHVQKQKWTYVRVDFTLLSSAILKSNRLLAYTLIIRLVNFITFHQQNHCRPYIGSILLKLESSLLELAHEFEDYFQNTLRIILVHKMPSTRNDSLCLLLCSTTFDQFCINALLMVRSLGSR
jgi:hypothetical protein